MKKISRRSFLMLTGAAAAAAALSACGSAASAGTAASTAAGSSAAGSAASGANSLTVWCWDPNFNIYAMKEAEKFYQKDHPDFTLNVVETPWSDLQTALTTAGTSAQYDTLPDIFLCQDNAFQKNVMNYPDMFVDMTDSGIGFTDFAASKVAYSTVDGKNYGCPFDNGTVIQCVRTDMLEQAGLKVDDFTDVSWADYMEKAKKVVDAAGVPMLSMQAGESDLIMMMMQSAGASLFDAEGKPDIASNATLKVVIETYAKLVNDGILTQVNDWDEYVGTLTGGKVSSTINGCWIMASIQSAADQSGKWAITNMPKLDGVSGATNYSNNGGSSWAVSSNCKDTALAFDFLKSTFAGSVDFYADILPSSGALATYLPAAKADVYNEPQEFFGGEAVYAKITEFAGKVPSNNTGVYYYEARDAVATALTNVIGGANVDDELKTAQETVEFAQQG